MTELIDAVIVTGVVGAVISGILLVQDLVQIRRARRRDVERRWGLE